MKNKGIEAMVLAAGLGTRLKHLTTNKPKALVEVNGKPLLEWVLRRIKWLGIERVVINVHHFADLVEAFLAANQNFGLDIRISDERDMLLETGGGIKKAEPLFSCENSILIWNVDIISDLDFDAFLELHKSSNSLATLAVRKRKSSRYLWWNKEGNLEGWEKVATGEKIGFPFSEDSKAMAFSGIHLVKPELFSYLPAASPYSIIPHYLRLTKNHRITSFDHSSSSWLDVGKLDAIPEAQKLLLNYKVCK